MAENTVFEFIVKEHHLDSYGHINNATYLEVYEEARWDLITPRGFGYADIHRLQQGPVILEVTLKFLKEIRLREKIRITTKVLKYEGKIGVMQQQMIKEDGAVASEANFVFGLFDMKERKLLNPTPEWKKAIGIE